MFSFMSKKASKKKPTIHVEEVVDEPHGVVVVHPDWPLPVRPKETYAHGKTFPKQLNESVFELYAPETRHQLEIVFFHGLQIGSYKNAYVETWKTDSICWPQEWLPLDFPNARIVSISYDASARRSEIEGQLDLPRLGEILVEDIILAAGIGAKCPVILVGHSLGGIVIKQLCLEADKRRKAHSFCRGREIKSFLKHIKGIFFYSVPHGGSQVATIVKEYVPKFRSVVELGPMLDYLTVLSTHTNEINEAFTQLRHARKWSTTAVCENAVTKLGLLRVLVVTEASANRDVDSFHLLKADHMSICKPRDTRAPGYVYLKNFILELVPL